MKAFLFTALCMVLQVGAHMNHLKEIKEEWVEEGVAPFDEWMLTWNAARPREGSYLFYASVRVEGAWSPWLLYVSWGSDGQKSYKAEDTGVKVYQDAVEILGKKADGFKVKVVTEGDATLENIYGLHVYTNSDRVKEPKPFAGGSAVFLDVAGISQMALDHIRHRDLCSPTSTTAVTRYLSGDYGIDPVRFAGRAWDGGFDIFGHWVFNVAEAATHLGPEWDCWVERLSGFEDIYARLQRGTPVIVSVRGPLPGSAQPYAKGHLMAVTGYDPILGVVYCMDPAFPSDRETGVSYPLSDFVEAWTRRGRVAYVFEGNGKRGI